MRRGLLALLALLALGACRAAPAPPLATARTAVPGHDVVAIAEHGGALYVVERDRLAIERAGTIVAAAAPPAGRWAEATAVAAPDDDTGDGAWIVARTTTNQLWRITATGEVEPIGDRLGIADHVRAIGAAGATTAMTLDDGVAIVRDRTHAARYELAQPGQLAVGRDRIALRRDGGRIELWDLAAATRVDYRVPGALYTGFVDAARAPRLVVATAAAIYVERDGLHKIAVPGPVGDLAIAGPRIWARVGGALYVVERDALARAELAPPPGPMFGLANGDVVVGAPDGAVRLSLAAADDWDAVVRPIFARVCSRCHLPGGDAKVDLSTAAAWRAERGELVHRLVETRTMPPAGVELREADRQRLATWLGR